MGRRHYVISPHELRDLGRDSGPEASVKQHHMTPLQEMAAAGYRESFAIPDETRAFRLTDRGGGNVHAGAG